MIIDKLKIEIKKETFEFSFDETCFYVEHKTKFSSGKKPYILENLCPNFGFDTNYNMAKLGMLRILLILAISSVVVFFSDYNEKIPLLAPVLLLMATGPFIGNFKYFFPVTWVRIYDDMGSYETAIPVPDNESEEDANKRKVFLEALSQKIVKINEPEQ